MAEKNILFTERWLTPGQNRHWLIPCLIVLILLGGFGWMYKARQQTDELLRQQLLDQAAAIARAITPEQLRNLSFTDGDANLPEFQRLSFQMRACAEALNFRSLYSMALRDGQIVFGPESLSADDPYASPPGTVYEKPSPQDFEIFKSGKASVQGPQTDEYGTFISALAPVLDPRTGGVLLVIGLDEEASEWRAAQRRAQSVPLLFTAGLLAILLAGSLLTHKYRRTDGSLQSLRYAEAIVSAAVMLMLTLLAVWTAHDTERRNRYHEFTTLAQVQASGIAGELAELRTRIINTKCFFESSAYVDRDEFGRYAAGFPETDFTQVWVWVPEVAVENAGRVEQEAHRVGAADFAIWQKNAQGAREPAAGRDRLYPALYIEPRIGHEVESGYDWGSDPVRRAAIEETLRTELPVITAPDELTAPTSELSGLFVMQSVRTATQTGVVAVTFRLDKLLRTHLYKSGAPETEISAGLFQLECGKPPRFLTSSSEKCGQACWEHHAKPSLAVPIFIFGRSYVVLVHPEPAWLAAHPLRSGWLVGAAGLMLTALLTAFIAFLSNRPTQLEREVQRRTMELHESEEKLRITLNSIGDAVIATDINKRVVWLNPMAEKLTGWSQKEAVGQPLETVFRIINEQTRKPVESPATEVLAEGNIVGLANHTLLIAKDGREIPITDSGAPIKDAAGAITGVVLVFRDQTEERAAQNALRKSAASLQEAQHMARIYRWSHDLQTGEIVWSDEAFRIFGVEKQPVTQELVDAIIHPADLHVLKEAMEAAARGRAINETETRFIRPDGTTGWLFNCWQSTYDQSGREIKRVGIGQNTTERKQRASELTRLSAAINHTAEAVVITDTEGIIEYVNPAFEVITGYLQKEAVGQNPRILKSGKHDEAFYRNLWQTISSGRNWEGRIINKRKDSTLYTEEVSISPVLDPNGVITNYVAVKRDITDELNKEEQLRQSDKMQAVGLLAGGVSHDFNNVLQAILGFSELLMDGLKAETLEHQHVSEIKKAALRATDLTRQLLVFSRKQPVEKNLLDINAIIRDADVLLHMLLGIEITREFDLAQNLTPVDADPGQMTQVVMNLAINARDAMPNGGRLSFATKNITFEPQAAAAHGAEPGSFVCLSVTDTGSGMSPEVKDHLFEPFFTTKAVGKGTGLGLSVVFGIVKQNKGWIHVYSEEGHGTTFNIYLPTYATAAPDKQTAWTHNGRILLVEDDADMRNLVIQSLKTSGCEFVAASSAEEALELFKQEKGRFDLLFSDIGMPGKSGIELADALRAEKPGLPVLLFSGYQDQRKRWANLESKGYFFLQKPFTVAGLLAAVHRALTEKIQ